MARLNPDNPDMPRHSKNVRETPNPDRHGHPPLRDVPCPGVWSGSLSRGHKKQKPKDAGVPAETHQGKC